MRIHELKQRLRKAGAGPSHEQRILRLWSHALPRNSGRRLPASFFPASLMEELPSIEAELAGLARVVAAHPGADGSERLLVALADGQTVESVLLPRDGLCVSSQVGCAVGCQFCMTGRDGLLRQVGSAEIIAQVALARMRRPVRKVVFMGMGEPAHNMDNVLEALEDGETFMGRRTLETYRERIASALKSAFPGVVFNAPFELSLPTTLNFSVPLKLLSCVAVSSGCSTLMGALNISTNSSSPWLARHRH